VRHDLALALDPRTSIETADLVSEGQVSDFKIWLVNIGFNINVANGDWEIFRAVKDGRKRPSIFYGVGDWLFLSGDYSCRKLMREFRDWRRDMDARRAK
jgi:hypothetical protein